MTYSLLSILPVDLQSFPRHQVLPMDGGSCAVLFSHYSYVRLYLIWYIPTFREMHSIANVQGEPD